MIGMLLSIRDNEKENTEPVTKCDHSKEVDANCDHPKEIVTVRDNQQLAVTNLDRKNINPTLTLY